MRGPLALPAAFLPGLALALGAAGCRRDAAPAGCSTGAVSADLRAVRAGEEVAIIVRLSSRADLAGLRGLSRRQRRAGVGAALARHAEASQGPLRALLERRGGRRIQPLPTVNGLAATVPAEAVPELAAFPGVESVTRDRVLRAPAVVRDAAPPTDWNLSAIGAPNLWSLGLRGAGAVVANMDTGVDGEHPDLKSRWRGGASGWLDPFNHTAAPYDVIGHGTHTMGILVGGSGVGVAPDATWIAAKIFDDRGDTTESIVHQAFQWLLDPDADPTTADGPDVVNASWSVGATGVCDSSFQPDVDAMKAAGMVLVFSAGNGGPTAPSSVSPAANPGSLAAGAIDAGGAVASFSGRGPSACGGGVYPDVVAPGVAVRTTDISLAGTAQYATVDGTSFAAPHVAGVVALLAGALPQLAPAAIEGALRVSARDLGAAGPDDLSGYGLVDATAAYAALTGPVPVTILTASLPAARMDVAYRQALEAFGGAGPYAWSVIAGALPPGLSLDPSTGAIAGTATAAGTFDFTVQVADAPGATASRPLSLGVLELGCPGG
jgi:subtilisin family serine protease